MATGDKELAELAAGGDRDAFRVLLERHYDRLYRFAYRFCHNHADAEDLAQDICLGLPSKLRSFRGEARFTTWLYRVVVNAAQDLWRRQATAVRTAENFAEIQDLNRATEEQTASDMDWVYQSLAAMSEELHVTALLVLAEGLSHAEAGEVLQVKESTISWRMHEIRKQLKSLLAETV
ncbi:MAG: RNA polymerase sigma factor [Pseudomonadota bacterium]